MHVPCQKVRRLPTAKYGRSATIYHVAIDPYMFTSNKVPNKILECRYAKFPQKFNS